MSCRRRRHARHAGPDAGEPRSGPLDRPVGTPGVLGGHPGHSSRLRSRSLTPSDGMGIDRGAGTHLARLAAQHASADIVRLGRRQGRADSSPDTSCDSPLGERSPLGGVWRRSMEDAASCWVWAMTAAPRFTSRSTACLTRLRGRPAAAPYETARTAANWVTYQTTALDASDFAELGAAFESTTRVVVVERWARRRRGCSDIADAVGFAAALARGPSSSSRRRAMMGLPCARPQRHIQWNESIECQPVHGLTVDLMGEAS